MKNNKMKSKLLAATLSLAMSFILLTSASFAWFTVSTAPAVEKIQVQMNATKNLEIARATDETTEPGEVGVNDAASQTNWGEIVSFESVTLDFPAAGVTSGIGTMVYDKTGRTTGKYIAASAASLSDGYAMVKGKIAAASDANANPMVITHYYATNANVGVKYGVWLRSNTALSDVKFSYGTTSDFKVKDQSGADVVFVTSSDVPTQAEAAIRSLGINVVDASTGSAASSGNIALTANTAKLFFVYVYIDGKYISADTIKNGLKYEGVLLQFESDTVASGSNLTPTWG